MLYAKCFYLMIWIVTPMAGKFGNRFLCVNQHYWWSCDYVKSFRAIFNPNVWSKQLINNLSLSLSFGVYYDNNLKYRKGQYNYVKIPFIIFEAIQACASLSRVELQKKEDKAIHVRYTVNFYLWKISKNLIKYLNLYNT